MGDHSEPFYSSDLARIHDAGFGSLARAGARTLLHQLRRAGIRHGRVVDLGCGSGITAGILLDAGYEVVGVDVSADFIALARANAPGARFVRASLYDFDLPPCVAVTSIGEPLSYAADPRAGREQAAELFARVFQALRPGGLFLFDLSEPGRERGGRRRTWQEGHEGHEGHEGTDWLLCFEAEEDRATQTLTRRITVFQRAGPGEGQYRRIDEVHVQRLYPREDVLADLAAAGFQARALAGYRREVRFRRGHAGFLAVRPVGPP
jgi:SAM-dependent methyltransferase